MSRTTRDRVPRPSPLSTNSRPPLRPPWSAPLVRTLAGLLLLLGLSACQTPPRTSTPESTPAPSSAAPTTHAPHDLPLPSAFALWERRPMPGKKWVPFVPTEKDGQVGLAVDADASLSLMRHRLTPPITGHATLTFSWWVHKLLPGADLTDADASDAPAQVMVAFDGDRSTLSARNVMMSELMLLLTGEDLPYASLIYAWSNEHPPGTVLIDPRIDRIRYLVVEQGPNNLGRWLHYERDVWADFTKAFNEPPGPIAGLAIMTDTDNTRTQTHTLFGPVTLTPTR